MKLVSSDPDLVCAQIAQRQMGLISVAQAFAAGLSRQQISYRRQTGAWLPILPQVYAFAGSPPLSLQRIYATHLCLGDSVVFSGPTAAALLGAENFRSEECVHVSADRSIRPARTWLKCHRITDISPCDMVRIDTLPVTGGARTLLDLSAILPRRLVERTLSDFLHRRLVTVPALEDQLVRNGRRGRDGTAVFRALVNARAGEPGLAANGFEVDLLALLKREGFPQPVQQFEIWHEGEFIARPDFCYPDRMIVVEADSYRWHSNPEDWRREQGRHNKLIALGWAVLRFTWPDLGSPHGFISDLRSAWNRRESA